VFRIRIRSGFKWSEDPYPVPGRPKLPPKIGIKEKKFLHVLRVLYWAGGFFWSLNVLCRGLKSFGLDPDPDSATTWIQIQIQ
jgi:hypothetical protein